MELTHVDAQGAARMVDVTDKAVTVRHARAQGRFVTTAEVIELLRRDGLPKGDALAVARIAGITGAKRTSDLLPLCHPIALHGVTIDLELGVDAVTITATTRTADRTGVEMEALTAVAAAGLTLYDMVKAVDRGAVLGEIRLLTKDGGRTGSWARADTADDTGEDAAGDVAREAR
jgi:cyclic pyranopterin phosphate synthase